MGQVRAALRALALTEPREDLRHLPIVGGNRIVAMLTIGDLLAARVDEQEVTITELHRYVFDLR